MQEIRNTDIRYFLGVFIGHQLVDVTQHDEDADDSDRNAYFVELLFDNGGTIRFFSRPGTDGPSFVAQHPDDCECQLCKYEPGEENDDAKG
jgi:hypothetical protein